MEQSNGRLFQRHFESTFTTTSLLQVYIVQRKIIWQQEEYLFIADLLPQAVGDDYLQYIRIDFSETLKPLLTEYKLSLPQLP